MTFHMPDLEAYRVPRAGFKLSERNPADTQGVTDQVATKARLAEDLDVIDDLQERLFVEGAQSLLVVLQAMDAAGKDSTIQAVTEGLNPQGVSVAPFRVPCGHEMAHDFLWRVHDVVPPKGHITFFNRSHYEDVLVVKVRRLAPAALVRKRYRHINDFERLLADHGTRIVKIMLHISKDYQAARFRKRLADPDTNWKFNPDDLAERERWPAYMAAYETALRRTSTPWAPWYCVPGEERWWRNLVVTQIVRGALESMDPRPPPLKYDPALYRPESIR